MKIGSGQLLGRRDEQQDRFAVVELDGVTVLVLADGIGGLAGGEVASDVAVEAFVESLGSEAPADLWEALDAALLAANEAIARTVADVPRLQDMGTTLVALAIDARAACWVSVGDSLLLRLRAGTATRLNRVHTRWAQLQERVRRGELSEAEAERDPERASITSALQGTTIPEIDRGEEALEAGDGFAVVSDGVLSLGFERLEQGLLADGSPEARVKGLLDAVERAARPDQDNVTLLVAAPATAGTDPADPVHLVDLGRRVALAATLLVVVPLLAWLAFGR